METDFQTPSVLEKAILNGHCVAFVGAGFSAAGGLPAWGPLLQSMLAEVADGQVSAEYIRGRIAHGTAHALDEAAQAL